MDRVSHAGRLHKNDFAYTGFGPFGAYSFGASGAPLREGGKADGDAHRAALGSAPGVAIGPASVASGATLREGGKADGYALRVALGSAPSVATGPASVLSGATLREGGDAAGGVRRSPCRINRNYRRRQARRERHAAEVFADSAPRASPRSAGASGGVEAHGVAPRATHGSAPSVNRGAASVTYGATLSGGGKAHGVAPRAARGSAPSVNRGAAAVAYGATLREGSKADGDALRVALGSAPGVATGPASVLSGATLREGGDAAGGVRRSPCRINRNYRRRQARRERHAAEVFAGSASRSSPRSAGACARVASSTRLGPSSVAVGPVAVHRAPRVAVPSWISGGTRVVASPVSTLGFASSAPAANRQAGLRRVSGESAGRGYRDRPSGMIGGNGWPLRELRAVGNIGDLATKPVIGADFWRCRSQLGVLKHHHMPDKVGSASGTRWVNCAMTWSSEVSSYA